MRSELYRGRFVGSFSGVNVKKDRKHAVRRSALLALSAAVAGLGYTTSRSFGDIYGNNGGTALNVAGSWTDESTTVTDTAPPGAADIARWDSLSVGGNTVFNLGQSTSWLGISIANPSAAVTIGSASDNSSGGALTLGASGINMSLATQNLSIADALSLSASQTWSVATGQTLTLATPFTNASVLTVTGGGNVAVNNVNYVISGAGSLIKDGSGTMTLGAVNTYAGSTTINNGTLVLNIASILTNNATGGSFPILPAGTTLFASGGTVSVLGGSSPSGSDVAYQTTISTISSQAGATTFTQTRGGDSRVIVNINNLNRSAGGTVNVFDNLTTNNTTDNANSGGYRVTNNPYNSSTNTGVVVNGVVPWLTYTTSSSGTTAVAPLVQNNPNNVSWFAPSSTGNGLSNNGAQYASYTSSTVSSLGTSTQNIDVVSSVAVPLGTTVNTLRFNNSSKSYALNVSSGDTLVVGAGGILVTGLYANHGGSINGGTLEGGNPGSGSGNDLMIIDFDDPANGTNSTFTIGSVIADNTTNGNTFGLATALTKSGIGTLILTSAANTYTGGTFLNGGITSIAGEGATAGSLGAVPVAPVSNNISFNGGTLQFTASFNLNSNRGITLLDTGGTIATNGFNTSYGGVITGTGSLTKTGAGVFALSGNNTYSGNTNISAGSFSVVNTAGSATGTGNVSIAAGAYLTGTGSIAGGVTLAGGATNGSGAHIDPGLNGVGIITVGSLATSAGSVADLEFASNTSYDQVVATNLNISGGGVNLFQSGSTILPYSSNGTHTYDLFSYTGSLIGSASNLVLLNGVSGFTYSFGSTTPVGGTPGYVTLTTSGTAAGVISQWNTAVNNQVWSNPANWTAGVPHSAGDIASFLTIAGQTAPIAVTLDAPESVGEIIFNDAFSYTITASGTGALTLDNGTSATPAMIYDQGGIHTITAPITLNSNTNIVTTNPTDVITLNGNIAGAGTLSIGTIATGSFGTVVLTGTNTYADPTTIYAGNTLQVGANSSTGSLGGTNLVDNGTFIVNRSNVYAIAGNITGAGNLVQAGAGMLILSGTNTYSGYTNVSAGSIQQGSATALGSGNLTLAAGTLLDMNGFNASVGSIAGAGTIDNIAGGGTVTLTAGGSNATSTFSGSIKNTTGITNFVKTGTGVLTLSGSSSYTGTTTIGTAGTTAPNAGTLTLTGTLSGGGAFTAGDYETVNINGASITAATFSFGGNENAVVSMTAGSLNIAGLLAADNDNGNSIGYMSLTGGTVTAGSVTIGRTSTSNTAIVTAGASTTSGIYVNGGTLNIATTLGVGLNSVTNSSANMRMDAGSVTVAGTTTITNNQGSSPARYSLLDLAGGTFTCNDTTGGGIVIGGSGFATPAGELLIRGTTTVVTANTITFGNSNQTGGALALEMLGGTLYLGSGGMVSGGGSVTPAINIGGTAFATAPTLAASASWSSPYAMIFTNSSTGIAPIFQAANASGGAENIYLSGMITGNGGLTKTGGGVLAFTGETLYRGATNISAGTLVDNFDIILAATSAININGSMIIQSAPSLQGITQEVAGGYNGGAWNGSSSSNGIPITSTAAANDTKHLTALGVIQNDNGSGTQLYSTFETYTSLNDSDVLIKYTYYGDTDLNGKVDGTDYSRIDYAYKYDKANPGSPLTGWFNGDFNYDGVIDGSDYTLMDNAFNRQGAQFSAQAATATALVGGGNSAVPEPATLSLAGIAMASLLGRRRRN